MPTKKKKNTPKSEGGKKEVKLKYPYDINDVDTLFDLIIFKSYTAGHFDEMMLVDESREVFRKIKNLLSNRRK